MRAVSAVFVVAAVTSATVVAMVRSGIPLKSDETVGSFDALSYVTASSANCHVASSVPAAEVSVMLPFPALNAPAVMSPVLAVAVKMSRSCAAL